MKKNIVKKTLAFVLSAAMISSMPAASNLTNAAAAQKSVKLNAASKTLTAGKTFKLRLKNNSLGWAIQKAVSKNRKICTVQNKKTYAALTAKKAGSTKIVLTISRRTAASKTVRKKLACSVKVKPVKPSVPEVPTQAQEPSVPEVPTQAQEPSMPSVPAQTTQTVETQAQLDAALANPSLTAVTLKTDASDTFVIPASAAGSYNADLTVDAPNADIENSGVFKSVTVNAIKETTWIEKASGNKMNILSSKGRFIVETGASLSQVVFKGADAVVELVVNGTGTVGNVTVETKLSLVISGTTTANVPVNIAAEAKDASLQAKAPVDIKAQADVKITLEEGAEKSTIEVQNTSSAVDIKNNSKEEIKAKMPDGSTKTAAANGGSAAIKPSTGPSAVTPSTPAPSFSYTPPSSDSGSSSLGETVKALNSIALDKTALSLEPDGTYELKAAADPADASIRRTIWKSSDTAIASVTEKGKVTAIAAGKADITVEATDRSGNTKSASCAVTVTLPIRKAVIVAIADQAYTGSEIKPALTVTYNGKPLALDTDYTAAYANNTNLGKAAVTITGKGIYSGTATAEFTIVPKKLSAPVITLAGDARILLDKRTTKDNITTEEYSLACTIALPSTGMTDAEKQAVEGYAVSIKKGNVTYVSSNVKKGAENGTISFSSDAKDKMIKAGETYQITVKAVTTNGNYENSNESAGVNVSGYEMASGESGDAVARIESTKKYYASPSSAITAATAANETITLVADYTVNASLVINKSITLNGNGMTIKAADNPTGSIADGVLDITCTSAGNVTINNLKVDAKEKSRCVRLGAHDSVVGDKMEVVMNKCELKGGKAAGTQDLGGGIFMKDMTDTEVSAGKKHAALTLNGCSITGNEAWCGGGIFWGNTSKKLTIKDTTITGNKANGERTGEDNSKTPAWVAGIWIASTAVCEIKGMTEISENTGDNKYKGGNGVWVNANESSAYPSGLIVRNCKNIAEVRVENDKGKTANFYMEGGTIGKIYVVTGKSGSKTENNTTINWETACSIADILNKETHYKGETGESPNGIEAGVKAELYLIKESNHDEYNASWTISKPTNQSTYTVTIPKDVTLEVGAGFTLTIGQDVKLEVKGKLILEESDSSNGGGKITGSGTIDVAEGGKVEVGSNGSIAANITGTGATGGVSGNGSWTGKQSQSQPQLAQESQP